MPRGRLTAIAMLALLLAACGDKTAAPQAEERVTSVENPPNVVLIIADSLGYQDVSANIGGSIQTPNIDAVARGGLIFTQAYAASSVSGPSRAAIFTGRHPSRFGYEYDNAPPSRDDSDKLGLPTEETTIADVLRTRKYRTALIGKWGMGFDTAFYPLNRGFDEFYGFLSGSTPQADPKDPAVTFVPTARFDAPPIRNRYTQIVRGAEQAIVNNGSRYLTTDLADQVVDFIDRNSQSRFFVTLAFTAPGEPLQALNDDLAKVKASGNRNRDAYVAMVQRLDAEVGRVMKALDNQGLTQNTLVIFTSDKGCNQESGACLCTGLRGGATTFYEGGVRVPLILHAPALFKPGSRYEKPVSLMDIFPTLLAVSGAQRPAGKRIDGKNLLPYVDGKRAGLPHETLLWMRRPMMAARYKDYKLIRDTDAGVLKLFDLNADPTERNDLAKSRPDLLAEAQSNMDASRTFANDPLWLSNERAELQFCGETMRMYR